MNKLIFIIIILSIFFIYTLFLKPVETFEKKKYDIIITINVHEKFPFLLKQLKNLSENISCSYAVILNCNEYMLNECKANELPPDVFFYQESLEKRRSHGSLTEGIYRNMYYALENFDFEYFVFASSRSMFDNNMTLEDLKKLETIEHPKQNPFDETKYNEWCWPTFSNLLLFKHYKNKNLDMHSCPHEGLVFTHRACVKIVSFLESNPEIKEETFIAGACTNQGSIEEFALQTIAVNEGETFHYVGNGCCTNDTIGHLGPANSAFKFSYKTDRELNTSRNTFVRCDI